MRFDPASVACVVDGVVDRDSKLLRGLRLGIPLVDPRLRLDDF